MSHKAIPGRRGQLKDLRKDRAHHLAWALSLLAPVT
jgi:hypothetical protein